MSELDKHNLHNKIVEVLVFTQFEHWIDKKSQTAEQINTRGERAIGYYMGEVKKENNFESNRFRSIVNLQIGLIMREIVAALAKAQPSKVEQEL